MARFISTIDTADFAISPSSGRFPSSRPESRNNGGGKLRNAADFIGLDSPSLTVFPRGEEGGLPHLPDFPNVSGPTFSGIAKNCGGQWSRRDQAASFYYTLKCIRGKLFTTDKSF